MDHASSPAAPTVEPAQAWWRHPFVWLVAGLPLAAVVAATISGVIAIRGADPVVPAYGVAARRAAAESLSREEAPRVPAELARNHAATPRR